MHGYRRSLAVALVAAGVGDRDLDHGADREPDDHLQAGRRRRPCARPSRAGSCRARDPCSSSSAALVGRRSDRAARRDVAAAAPAGWTRRSDAALAAAPADRLAVHQVRDAEEVGDEYGRRVLVDLRAGVPTCSIRPSFITATRSLMLSASSWSWVTNTNVIPTSSCSALSSIRSCLRILASSAPERLVEQQHGGAQHQRPGERDALLLAAGQLLRRRAAELAELDQLERLLDAPARPRRARPCGGAGRRRRCRTRSGAGTARSSGRPCGRCARCGGTELTSTPSSRISPAVGRSKPGDHPQRRRLAAARRAEQREELAAVDRRRRSRRPRRCSSKRLVKPHAARTSPALRARHHVVLQSMQSAPRIADTSPACDARRPNTV